MTGVCSTRNVQLTRSLGSDFVIDYTMQDFTRSDKKYDLIFDTVGKTSMKACMKLLTPKGKYLLTDFGFSHMVAAFISLFSSRKVIISSSNFHWKREDLMFLKEIAEKGYFRPVIDKAFPLEKIVDAHTYVERGHKVGNVPISVR